MFDLPEHSALLLIDVQQGFDDGSWRPRNNPEAEQRIRELLMAWRHAAWPVFHVQHDSPSPAGSFRPGTPGHRFKPEAEPHGDEPVYRKEVNSGFIGTALEAGLRAANVASLVIAGLTAEHCVSTTTRMAGNLGFHVFVVSDATASFEQVGIDGRVRRASEVHFGALSDLSGEFATIVDTSSVLEALRRQVGKGLR